MLHNIFTMCLEKNIMQGNISGLVWCYILVYGTMDV